jgi:gliding motility-associated-like protein
MKKHILFIAIVFFNLSFFGQTFSVNDAGDNTTNSGTDCASISVTGVPGGSALSEICVNITSNYDANLNVYVDPPGAGGTFPLSTGNGSSGDNYSNTCFSPLAGVSVEGASAPFNGTYVPEGCLWSDNLSATNGTWQVCVSGAGTGSSINLTSANLTFTTGGGSGYLEAADLCIDATPICSLDGYYGTTSACYGVQSVSPFCGSIENNSWLKFVAAATTVNLSVLVGNCQYNDGIQFALYETSNCSSFIYANNTSSNCYSPVNPGTNAINFTGLTVGQTYYLMIDGFAGDVCDYQVTAIGGGIVVTAPVSSAGTTICSGASTTLSINSAGATPTGYTWTQGATVISTGPTAVVSPTTTTTYDVEVLGACGPVSNYSITINVTPPTTPTFTARPAICSGASMSALPTTSNNGITGSWSPALNNTATTTYTFTPNGGQCAGSTTMTIVVNTAPTLTLSSVAATTSQTVCQNTPITNITYAVGGSATGAGVTGLPAGVSGNYSGGVFTISGTPTASGSFSYTVTTSGGSCGTLNLSGTIDVDPTPSITVPNSGEVCIGASLNLSPSSGGTWSSSNTAVATVTNGGVVSGLTAGSANMTFTNSTTGCASLTASGAITVNALPTANVSGITPVQPASCGSSTGAITGITSSGAATLTYSWNSSPVQTTQDLSNVPAGSYTLTITDGNSCVTTAGPFNLSDPTPPTPPTLSLAGGSTCVGGSATLSVNSPVGGATYTWTGPNGYTNTGSSITITPLTALHTGSYDVSTTISGCTSGNAAAAVTLTVNPLPYVDITTPLVVNCDNPVITLDGSNSDQTNSNFSWAASGGGAIIGAGNTDTETTSTPGDYTLTVVNSVTMCTDNSMVSVTDNFDTPTADITVSNGGQLDCNNSSLTLQGSGSTNAAGGTTGITYTWSTTSGGASIGSGTSYSATTAGDYYLLVEETISGCTNETMVTITSNTTAPTAVITNNNPLTCDSTSILLIGSTSVATGTISYDWQDAGSTTIGTSDAVSVSTTGNYSLNITDLANGCTANASVSVSQDITAPNVSVVSPIDISCTTPNPTLDGTGSSQGANIEYTWSTSGGTIIGDTDLDTAATVTAGTYNLLVENSDNGCTSNADVVVNLNNTPPVADAGTNVPFICGVSTVSLDGSGSTGTGLSYVWSGPGVITGGGSATPTVNTVGTFTLTVTGSNGCTDVSTVQVTPNTAIPFADAGSDTTITCNNPLPVVLDGSNSDPGMDYAWTTLTGNIVSGAATTAPTVDQAAGYQLTVTDLSNNCFDRDTMFVVMDTLVPTIDLSATTSLIFTCTSNGQVLLDGSNSLDNSTTGNNLTYVWSTTTGNIVNTNDSVATVDGAGDYLLQITGANGCTSISTTPISVSADTATPIITFSPVDDLDCIGTPVIIDASGSTGSNETYSWNNGDATNTTSVTTADTYVLTVTSDNGCSTIDSVEVFNTTGPVADFSATPITGNLPLDVDFTDNSTGNNIDYDWSFGDGNTDTIANPSNTYTELGDYNALLTVTDAQGCTDTTSINIHVEGESVLIIPNVFSPNGDGDNDILNLKGTNIIEVSGVVMNRWGQVIFEWSAIEAGWDGRTTSGTEASEGTYYYVVNAVGADGKEYEFNGPIQLVR